MVRRGWIRWAVAACVCAAAGIAAAETVQLASPNGQVTMTVDDGEQLQYSVGFKGQPLIQNARLGLDLQDAAPLGPWMAIAGSDPHNGQKDEFTVPHGKANPVRETWNGVTVHLREPGATGRRMDLEARAYDDGVAFRYVIPEQAGMPRLRVRNERTEFAFAKDGTGYPLVLAGTETSYEDNYRLLPLSALHPQELVALPFTVHVPGVAWASVLEADLDDWAGMYLRHTVTRGTAPVYGAYLSPRQDDAALAVLRSLPAESPWRVVLIGAEPGRLLESNLMPALNPPSKIADTSWIRPGKAAWDWWSGDAADNVPFKPGMNTETMRYYIDFAAASGLEYMMIDAGWAIPGPDEMDDIRHWRPEVDVPALVQYAASKGVKVWLWAHWTSVERYGAQAFPLMHQWGVVGVKIDFMDRDDQWMVNWYRKTLQMAAKSSLMIDYHGAFKPDGVERTWPNLMTRESVMGEEYLKWSARVTPDYNTFLPFTRELAGPLDYTPGGFRNATPAQFVARNVRPMVLGTRAHQLALYVVLESAFMMVSDEPGAYAGQPAFAFIREVPVNWDETRVLAGEPGREAVIARRHGKDWYVGAITNSEARDVAIPLAMLGAGGWSAEIYRDAADADTEPTHTVIEKRPVTSGSVLRVHLAPGGGCAIRISPE
jgi:alpha-glucosidase